MSSVVGGRRFVLSARGENVLASVVVLAPVAMVIAFAAMVMPRYPGLIVAGAAVAIIAIASGLSSPLVALVYLLVTSFFRLAIPNGPLPINPFLIAFGGLILSVIIWLRRQRLTFPAVGALEALIGLYLCWNIGSMLAPHAYAAIFPDDGTVIQVPRFILAGVAMPLVSLLLAIAAFGHERAIRLLLYSIMGFSFYSAVVSIFQFYAPSLVYPRYIVDATGWPGRAVGVFNQPVVNGVILVLGYLAALLVASQKGERLPLRVAGGVLAVLCCVGIYLTHTRAAWLSFAVVVALGIWLARGWRRGFVISAAVMVSAIGLNWHTFTSPDRNAGGVGSTSEIQDRLNMIATSVSALREKPVFGWGIGRFPSVNTFHHQQWSPTIPWDRGYGLASHLDLLGIAVELGLIGVSFLLLALVLIFRRLMRAVRRLDSTVMTERPFALFALLAFLTMLITGLTVDTRFFDFPNILVLMCVGAAIGRAEAGSDRRSPTLLA